MRNSTGWRASDLPPDRRGVERRSSERRASDASRSLERPSDRRGRSCELRRPPPSSSRRPNRLPGRRPSADDRPSGVDRLASEASRPLPARPEFGATEFERPEFERPEPLRLSLVRPAPVRPDDARPELERPAFEPERPDVDDDVDDREPVAPERPARGVCELDDPPVVRRRDGELSRAGI